MKEIIGFISRFGKELNRSVLAATMVFTAFLIFLNYHYQLDPYINDHETDFYSFYARYLIFLVAFGMPYFFYFLAEKKKYFKNRLFLFLLIISPAIFSWKMAMNTYLFISDESSWNLYWNQIIYWPLRLIAMGTILFIIWKMFFHTESFFGLTTRNFKWKPYLLMLIIMIPLIALASTQADFLSMYPKFNDVSPVLATVENNWPYLLLHELSYGSDFISVELFFRGFLILAFVKIAGKDAILPMACFYCTIHFGKPLGECISSFFGGMLLGIVVLNTRSIIGGLVVHLGIAWLMELGGYLGNALK